jgi:hypothetical protein
VTSLGIHSPGKRVLDVGCGANAPMTLMLHASGALVMGIDECVRRLSLGARVSPESLCRVRAGDGRTKGDPELACGMIGCWRIRDRALYIRKECELD